MGVVVGSARATGTVATSFDASAWLTHWLQAYPWSSAANDAQSALVQAATSLPKPAQLALLKAAVARLPELRGTRDRLHWQQGTALYELVCRLYHGKLKYSEQDICTLLLSSKHDCGHGDDIKPPFELALRWLRTNGTSPSLMAALRTFLDGMQGLSSVKANDAKTKGNLVLLLDPARAATRCHSERFRTDLFALEPAQRRAWERLVLHMGTTTSTTLPKGFDDQAGALLAFLGSDQVLNQLDRWLPRRDESGSCRLETSGSHLYRHFIWLLMMISEDATLASRCDAMLERVLRVDFNPTRNSKKLLVAAAVYFAQRPLTVRRTPLEEIRTRLDSLDKTPTESGATRKLIEDALAPAK